MELEIAPDPAQDERRAIEAALEQAGLGRDEPPPAYGSPWRRAALEEAAGAGDADP